jgi:ABC-type sulfate transport system permease subunit
MKRVLLGSIAVAALFVTFPGAQMRVVPVDELQGHAMLAATMLAASAETATSLFRLAHTE